MVSLKLLNQIIAITSYDELLKILSPDWKKRVEEMRQNDISLETVKRVLYAEMSIIWEEYGQ